MRYVKSNSFKIDIWSFVKYNIIIEPKINVVLE